MRHVNKTALISILFLSAAGHSLADSSAPLPADQLVFGETDGLVVVEAEHFYRQSLDEVRRWHVISEHSEPGIEPDGDPAHLEGASGGAYLESLPDTRRTHDDELISGENFSNEPGQLAVLHYRVHFTTPGRYYVWVRAYSTGTEDNGIHVGLNGAWPQSGRRMQWCQGKHGWRWESRQRTKEQHCGEAFKIWLDITEPGLHDIQFSLREDGFEFDKFALTLEREFPAALKQAALISTTERQPVTSTYLDITSNPTPLSGVESEVGQRRNRAPR